MSDAIVQFKALLRELFQFDCADLDFGIYRIMNQKREAVERFIEQDLVAGVKAALAAGTLGEQAEAAKDLCEVRKEIAQTLGEDALEGNGTLAQAYHRTPLGRRYRELQGKVGHGAAAGDLEAAVFNHLVTFFGRYYDNGDFISKRRYSRNERYAIPYNGEEVVLHWANKDQYYVKTGEYFRNYSFRAAGVTVRFELRQAQVEKDNVKGDRRFFVPLVGEAAWDEKGRTVAVPFEYRPLTEQEEIACGRKNQQDKIIAKACEELPARFAPTPDALAALVAERGRNADGEPVTAIEHHLRAYTRRNISDFFIHKDLAGFLTRELDFYLKNEVLNLDELAAGGEARAPGWFQLLQAIRAVGAKVIAFLAQLEDFQKRLFEKKKFVTSTTWLITLDHVLGLADEELRDLLLKEIAGNAAQTAEWVTLFGIDGWTRKPDGFDEQGDLFRKGQRFVPYSTPLKPGFLRQYPHLPLDTRFFPPSFTDLLLGTLDDLDGSTDGLLIHGENFQALNLLQERYRAQVKCIYIDPPYNTGSDEFIYKDGLRDSSWLTMMQDRAAVAGTMMHPDGLFLLQIGDDEEALSREMLRTVFPERKNSVVARRGVKNVQAQFDDIERLNQGHDTIHVFSKGPGVRLPHLIQGLDETKPGKWDTFWRGTDRATMRYELLGETPKTGQWRWEPTRARRAVANYEHYKGAVAGQKTLDEWYVENLQAGEDLDFVRRNDEGVVQYYVPPQSYRLVSDNWLDLPAAGSLTDFPHEKSLQLLTRALSWNTKPGDVVLDYFGGSGSTAHAAMQAGRSNTAHARKFVLVEMAGWFASTLVPRVKQYTLARDWKDGRPQSLDTGISQIVKVLSLESYEDALNNLRFDEARGQRIFEFEDCRLHYFLAAGTAGSETFLDVEKLERPFQYTLRLVEDGIERSQPVDLPETFAYLLGLRVRTRRVHEDRGRRYLVYRGALPDGREAAVLWRDLAGWTEDDYQRDRDFVAREKLAEGAALIFVNGQAAIPGATALDTLFKDRMFEGHSQRGRP